MAKTPIAAQAIGLNQILRPMPVKVKPMHNNLGKYLHPKKKG